MSTIDSEPPSAPRSSAGPSSARSTVKRLPDRASYDREVAHAILDAGILAHVGLATDAGPVVIPMLYARDGDRLLLHGSPASRLLRKAGSGTPVCVTVTHLDGLVLARSAFHHSVNYRSVVVFGEAQPIADLGERRAALDRIVEGVVPGRTSQPHAPRPPSDRELKGTTVLALPLDEVSVKQRTGGPVDEDEDYALSVWAGVVPFTLRVDEPIPDPRLAAEPPSGGPPPVPEYAAEYARPGLSASP